MRHHMTKDKMGCTKHCGLIMEVGGPTESMQEQVKYNRRNMKRYSDPGIMMNHLPQPTNIQTHL